MSVKALKLKTEKMVLLFLHKRLKLLADVKDHIKGMNPEDIFDTSM